MKKNETSTLNDVCELIVDCLHNTAPTQKEGYPLIRTPNIQRGRLDLKSVYRVSEENYDIWTQRAVPQTNDLILAREAPAGNVAIVKEGQTVCLGQRTVLLRPNAEIVDPDFLCYFLLAPKQQGRLLAGETGATAKHVNMKDIRRLSVEGLPDLDVQKKAGRILAAYDDLIENNRRRIELLEESARLLYREWFVYLRFPGHEHTPIIDDIPEGWKLVTLDKVLTITQGFSFKSQDFIEQETKNIVVTMGNFKENGGFPLPSDLCHPSTKKTLSNAPPPTIYKNTWAGNLSTPIIKKTLAKTAF